MWSALSGFLALAWEIVWSRLYDFASESRAEAFGAMLGSYLLGLAGGALWSMRWHDDDDADSLRSLGLLILAANLIAFLVVPIASWIVVKVHDENWVYVGLLGKSINFAGWFWTLPLVALASALQGTILPLLCHVAIPPDHKAGARLSYVYLANIAGSGAGSLLTGFVLLEYFPLAGLAAGLLVFAAALVLVFLPRDRRLVVISLTVAALPLLFGGRLHDGLWERLQFKTDYNPEQRFAFIQESRHGVVCVDGDRKVYGNGAYDGYIGTELPPGDYHVRPYFISAVHPKPLKKVLVIGVSAGAWTQIIASHPDQPEVDAVEISAAYLDIIAKYPQVSGVLNNPRVHIHIDDGRRWLKRNPDSRFDAILMNTTHHWREFASALLSREFLSLAKSHLEPDGIVIWNCTDSKRAAKTGLEVFPYTMMCLNNCIGSNQPLIPHKDRWRQVLTDYRINGQPLYDLQTADGKAQLDGVLQLLDNEGDPESFHKWWISSRERMERLCEGQIPITDDNLGHEY